MTNDPTRKTNAFIEPEDDDDIEERLEEAGLGAWRDYTTPKWQTEFRLKKGEGRTIILCDWSAVCERARLHPDEFETSVLEYRNGPRSDWRPCPVAPPRH